MKQDFSTKFLVSFMFKGSPTCKMKFIMSTRTGDITLGHLYSDATCFKKDNSWNPKCIRNIDGVFLFD